MSRESEFSSAISKRAMEAALREAGLSIRDAKTAVSVFCRLNDDQEGPGVASGKHSYLGKFFTKLKRKLRAPESLCGGMLRR